MGGSAGSGGGLVAGSDAAFHGSAPVARTRNLIVTAAADADVLVYDPATHHIHKLNAAAAAIWRLCDGRRSVAELARDAASASDLHIDERAVTLALTKLGEAGLLAQPEAMWGRVPAQSRRAFVRRAAVAGAVAVPAVISMTAPAAAGVASGCTSDGDCRAGFQCTNNECTSLCHSPEDYCADGSMCPTGWACNAEHDQCCGQICQNGLYCGGDASNCPVGYDCIGGNNNDCCVTHCGPWTYCGPGTDGTCKDGYYCKNGECCRPIEQRTLAPADDVLNSAQIDDDAGVAAEPAMNGEPVSEEASAQDDTLVADGDGGADSRPPVVLPTQQASDNVTVNDPVVAPDKSVTDPGTGSGTG